MTTPTEQEVAAIREYLFQQVNLAWFDTGRVARWHLSQVAAKDERIRELEKALKFYADEWLTNYEGDVTEQGLHRTWREPTNKLIEDSGFLAQSALKTKEAGK